MTVSFSRTRFLCCLVIAAVGSLVAGAPLLRLASATHRPPMVMTEGESTADGELHSFDCRIPEVASVGEEIELGPQHVHAIEEADELGDTEFAFADGHLHRGPPRC